LAIATALIVIGFPGPAGSVSFARGSPSAASTKSEVVSSGDVTAVLSYVEKQGKYSELRIKVTRAGVIVRDEAVPCGPPPSFRCSGPAGAKPEPSPLNAGSGKSIGLRNIDDDPDPEVLADFFTGGANCCVFSVIYDFAGASGYTRIVWPWGGTGYRLKDLGGTQVPEFASFDYRFADVFCAHACSDYPVQIWRFRGGRLRNVTGSFPAAVANGARAHWRLFLRMRKRPGQDVKGILAAYMAEEYLLGLDKQGWRRLRRARRAGYLNRGFPPHGSAYLKKLRRFLRRTGYGRPSKSANARATKSHPCGRIDVTYPHGWGGASAIGIRATNLSCSKALKIVFGCLNGELRHGWRGRAVDDRSVYRSHVLLTSGRRRITYHEAGGGGSCSG
jgi:hypothetical protein